MENLVHERCRMRTRFTGAALRLCFAVCVVCGCKDQSRKTYGVVAIGLLPQRSPAGEVLFAVTNSSRIQIDFQPQAQIFSSSNVAQVDLPIAGFTLAPKAWCKVTAPVPSNSVAWRLRFEGIPASRGEGRLSRFLPKPLRPGVVQYWGFYAFGPTLNGGDAISNRVFFSAVEPCHFYTDME
jgi:hypothetical protein